MFIGSSGTARRYSSVAAVNATSVTVADLRGTGRQNVVGQLTATRFSYRRQYLRFVMPDGAQDPNLMFAYQ